MTVDDFREIALGLPDAIEGAHMNHPDFRAAGRIFATLHADGERGTVNLPPPDQRAFSRTHPAVFSPAAGAWGRQGWTMVRLDAADVSTVRAAMLVAWQQAVDQGPARRPRTGLKTTREGARRRASRRTR
jgi:hypothetical protein